MEKFLEIKKNKLGIGTWKMGEIPKNKNEEIASIRYALENGIRLIDTAEMYGNGNSEKLIAESIKDFDREKLYLVSKVLPSNAGEKNIFKSCENSLKNLNVDYLDLYLLHWRGSIPFEETIRCMEKLKKDGKIKNWGVSNMDIDDMQELLSIPNGKNCLVNQVLYHLASKGIEYSLKPLTDKNHITTMAYCPIAQGGRLKNQLLFSKSVQELSKKYSISPIQVLLTYMLQKENTISIPKASKLEHMKEIVACRDIHFEKEDILLLDSEYPKPTKKLSLDIE
ncbi:aldo/keto reductase [Fusobacterium hwasookii ChDC F174]|jgi:ARA1 protein|uniref:Aldo/keto reductase n=1 Tax=Fusobacterium hwasookii ChDC F174 TaxID=1307442 RepID=A0A0S2ZPQ4_9FUSO|nr:aldo/keto reductase [Fusobacterium hwasookii]ALQ40901.1 aldo/keto reductase [Fusobacterium hwasookii ChDC F174]